MNKLINILFSGICILAVVACAKLGAPSGGPKDEDPPLVEKSKPVNYSTNYNRKKVIIKFDEFIVLKNQFNEFTISPPLEKKPLPQTKGRAIVIELPASKLDSLTYTIDFGQSIEDLNEGNKLPNFQFVISKQNFVDSFAIEGKIVDAFTHQPDKDQFSVYLHKNLADSAPYKVIPSYLSRTNPEGKFAINHVAPGTYSVFALKDINNNMLFDLPNEAIAFSDTLIYLNPDSFSYKENLPDTSILADTTVKALADSAQSDTNKMMLYGYTVNLLSFTEEQPYKQYLVDYSRNIPEKFTLFFNEPLNQELDIKLLNPDTTGVWYYAEKDIEPDTLNFWLADSNLVGTDSIVLEITYPFTDSTGMLIGQTDTLLLRTKAKTEEKKSTSRGGFGRGRRDEAADTLPVKIPRLPYVTNINKNGHDLNIPIIITANAPIKEFDKKLYKICRLEDTLEIPVNSSFEADTSNPGKYVIKMDYESEAQYKLDLYEGLFRDIYTRTIDSTTINFTTQRDDYYGIIHIKFENISSPIIVQLLGAEEKIEKQTKINTSQTVTFDYLKPGKYSLKIISDDNNNGKWDTGNLKNRKQPERVDYFPQQPDVRSNWEVEYTWEVKW